VDQYYNDSTGDGDNGECDVEAPWNTGIEVIESPALAGFQVLSATPKAARTSLNGAENKSNKAIRKGRR
jgi:Mn-containing catalase